MERSSQKVLNVKEYGTWQSKNIAHTDTDRVNAFKGVTTKRPLGFDLSH
jgi:hypothetical protein